MNPKKILFIKHGSLGDIISATFVFKCLRKRFNNAKIHLLTSEKYKDFLQKSNLFDLIITDNRNNNFSNLSLILKVILKKYDIVIDLQNSQRTMIYCLFFRIIKNTMWNGTRFGSSIRYYYNTNNPPHIIDGLENQIKLLGINCNTEPYLDWLKSDYKLPDQIKDKPFFIINPGCSKKSIQKRWAPLYFAEICQYLFKLNIVPVIIGSHEDTDIVNEILLKTNSVLNLLNLSPLSVIYSLSQKAIGALSNDTGPAHLIAGTGCKIHLILSSFSKISQVTPRGNNVSYTQKENINDINPQEIILALKKILDR
tara:strand:- start:245 stop:1177 length:933 start_codon:yes stop_codon:yes gene_type:complete